MRLTLQLFRNPRVHLGDWRPARLGPDLGLFQFLARACYLQPSRTSPPPAAAQPPSLPSAFPVSASAPPLAAPPAFRLFRKNQIAAAATNATPTTTPTAIPAFAPFLRGWRDVDGRG
jgi:hypothetical protein